MRFRQIVGFCFAALFATYAQAEDDYLGVAGDYFNTCGEAFQLGDDQFKNMTDEEMYESMACVGYARGILDATKQYSEILLIVGADIGIVNCMPLDATASQVMRVATNYIRENPEKENFTTFNVVNLASKDAWCDPE